MIQVTDVNVLPPKHSAQGTPMHSNIKPTQQELTVMNRQQPVFSYQYYFIRKLKIHHRPCKNRFLSQYHRECLSPFM